MADVLTRRLDPLLGQKIAVIMVDGRAFLGTLAEFDTACLVLEDVVEGTTENARGWEEPTVGTGMSRKVVTWSGIYREEARDPDVVRLRNVLVQLHGVLRIWEWSEENLAQPSHLEVSNRQGLVVDPDADDDVDLDDALDV